MSFNYIFPIFAFGVVISGVVFLGLQQAADLAKALDEERRRTEGTSPQPKAASTNLESNPHSSKPNHSTSHS